MQIKRALISVSNKQGVVDFARKAMQHRRDAPVGAASLRTR